MNSENGRKTVLRPSANVLNGSYPWRRHHAKIVKRHGAAVVVMAFDEEGQAATCEEKVPPHTNIQKTHLSHPLLPLYTADESDRQSIICSVYQHCGEMLAHQINSHIQLRDIRILNPDTTAVPLDFPG